MLKISVAMATFNGQDYIGKQLDSLAGQSYLPNELVVCDDGSTDNTISILNDFAHSAPFTVRVISNDKNIGVLDNFFKVAKYCSGDWICFCDQDDYWYSNKISLAVDEILRRPSATLVLQRAYLADAVLTSLGVPFPEYSECGQFESNDLDLFFEWHGFLQTVRADIFQTFDFNNRPVNIYRSFKYQSHDQWTCMIANAIGGISILPEIVALYRRHPKTVTGTYEKKKISMISRLTYKPSAVQLVHKAKVCKSYTSYLSVQREKKMENDVVQRLGKAIEFYELHSKILFCRSKLYIKTSLGSRLAALWKLIVLGGYSRSKREAVGPKAFVRDIIQALL